MIIHQKIIKKILRLLIMVICLSLSIFILVAYSHKSDNIDKNIGQNRAVTNTKLSKIAFEENNNVYLYDEISAKIASIGDKSKSKDLLELSPDKTKLVFREFNKEKVIYPPHLSVYDIKTKKITDIVINDKNTQQIIELKWVDNENILVTGHINPSASGYAVYNIESKAELISCKGTLRDVILNKKNILYSSTPHGFRKLKANLYLNGSKIFEVNDDREDIVNGVISKDGKMLAFISRVEDEKNPNGKTSDYLNIADINSDSKAIRNLKKTIISSDKNVDLKFDDENNISFIGDEFIYKLKDGNVIKGENILTKQAEISPVKLKKFKQILAKQFPKGFISDETLLADIGIYNIVEF